MALRFEALSASVEFASEDMPAGYEAKAKKQQAEFEGKESMGLLRDARVHTGGRAALTGGAPAERRSPGQAPAASVSSS